MNNAPNQSCININEEEKEEEKAHSSSSDDTDMNGDFTKHSDGSSSREIYHAALPTMNNIKDDTLIKYYYLKEFRDYKESRIGERSLFIYVHHFTLTEDLKNIKNHDRHKLFLDGMEGSKRNTVLLNNSREEIPCLMMGLTKEILVAKLLCRPNDIILDSPEKNTSRVHLAITHYENTIKKNGKPMKITDLSGDKLGFFQKSYNLEKGKTWSDKKKKIIHWKYVSPIPRRLCFVSIYLRSLRTWKNIMKL